MIEMIYKPNCILNSKVDKSPELENLKKKRERKKV